MENRVSVVEKVNYLTQGISPNAVDGIGIGQKYLTVNSY